MSNISRRYDIDWLRVIAIALLLIYHTAIGFQPWGLFLGFITNKQPLESLWMPMQMLNVWRIPFLFFVSGMGVYFALQRRSVKQLLMERSKRILIPFVFGVFVIVPLQILLIQHYYNQPLSYVANPAHLWFLGNIFLYVLLLLPLFYYIKKNEQGKLVTVIRKIFSHPAGLLIVFAVFIIEVLLVKPLPFELYAMKWHGFFLGLIAFITGFCFVLAGTSFWNMLLKLRWILLAAAVSFYIWRIMQAPGKIPDFRLSIESNCWILAVFAFGYSHLNRPGKVLNYLSEAAYPVYIMHMLFLYLASMLIFPLEMNIMIKYLLTLIITVGGSMIFYELVIKRIPFIRVAFGLKYDRYKKI